MQNTKYSGKDNLGKPKSDYLSKIAAMDDKELHFECERMIWLSAYAANNNRADYHWQCDACYDECKTRNKEEIYSNAHKSASESL